MSVIPRLVSPSTEATVKFETLKQLLLNAKWHSPEACNEVVAQFTAYVIEVKQNYLAEFLNFKISKSRLDEFYWNYMKNVKYTKLWEVFQIIFTLSHGQTAVERGFSINLWRRT